MKAAASRNTGPSDLSAVSSSRRIEEMNDELQGTLPIGWDACSQCRQRRRSAEFGAPSIRKYVPNVKLAVGSLLASMERSGNLTFSGRHAGALAQYASAHTGLLCDASDLLQIQCYHRSLSSGRSSAEGTHEAEKSSLGGRGDGDDIVH